MKIITLYDQLEWVEKCLAKMKEDRRPQGEIDLQESVVFTLSQRIKEKGGDTE